MISIIIPAHDEAGYIGTCLGCLLASDAPARRAALLPEEDLVEVIVVANGCSDATAEVAFQYQMAFVARGWRLIVLIDPVAHKINALNRADSVAAGGIRIYLDADVQVSPPLIALLVAALDRPEAAYASGRPDILTPRSGVSRRYARFWMGLPFMTSDVPGCGIYAVNSAGRQRWQCFPDIMADDIFVRMHFGPHERLSAPARYSWPIAEGLGWLVKVRRRQNSGLRQLRIAFPHLARQSERTRPKVPELLRLMARDPLGFGIYSSVALLVSLPLFRTQERWPRGR